MINESNSVVRITDPISRLGSAKIELLKDLASKTKLKRSRICLHENDNSMLQEMHICLYNDSYIRPAKHLKKVESLTVIDGFAKLFLFLDTGYVSEIIELGPYLSGKNHYYRLNYPVFHTLLIQTETFVFHEVTEGPFELNQTESAKWSPDGTILSDNQAYIEFLKTAQVGNKFYE